MSSPQAPVLCQHRQNPKACLTCFHARGRQVATAQQPRRVVGGEAAPVAPPHIQRAIDRQLRGTEDERVAVPAPRGEQAFNPAPRAPAPVQQAQAMAQGASAPQPWRADERQPWEPNADGLLVPPKRQDIIDRQPQHPHLGQTTRH